MKTLKLLFFTAAAVAWISQALFATPIRATVWEYEGTGKRLYFYGDRHYDLDIPEVLEKQFVDKFIAVLKSLPEEKGKTLFLLENWGMHSEALANFYRKVMENSENRCVFLTEIEKNLGEISSKVSTESVDFRHYWFAAQQIFTNLMHLEGKLSEQHREYLEAFNAIGLDVVGKIPMSEFFYGGVRRIDYLLGKTKNLKLKEILQKIRVIVEEKTKKIFESFYNAGFNSEMVSKMTMFRLHKSSHEWRMFDASGQIEAAQGLEAYDGKFMQILLSNQREHSRFDSEEVDARLLSQIVDSKDLRKIIVVAGALHILGVEEYLPLFGYKQIRNEGPNSMNQLRAARAPISDEAIDWMLEPALRKSPIKRKKVNYFSPRAKRKKVSSESESFCN